LKCNGCGVALDLTMASCPACGAEVELGRLTGILGVVCRACDAYNEPRARACAGCGAPLAVAEAGPAPAGAPAATASASPRGAPRPAEPTWFTPPRTAPPPAPEAPRAATLVLERGAGRPGATFPIAGEAAAVGREGAVAFPDDPCLAPRHATFLQRGGALHVRDEGAPGGVFLRLRGLSVALRPGDQFAVGDRLLRYGGPIPPPPPAGRDGTRRLGAPRPPPGSVVLEERLEGGAAGRVHLHPGPTVRIGRLGCAVALDDPLVAPEHAEILLDGEGGARLRDLGSETGTYLRIPPHGERELRDGDALRIGREVLRVVLG
jgi:hypothetical protein